MSGHFSDQDAAAILKAAAELQEKAAAGALESGVSITDLKRIAEESGIDPAYVDQALIHRASGGEKKSQGRVFEVVLPGEVAPDRLDVVTDSLSSFRGMKPLSQIGRTVQGMVQAPWTMLQIEVGSRNGRTRLTVRPLLVQTFMMTGYTPSLLCFLSLVLGFALKGPLIGLGLAALFGLVAWQFTAFGFQKAENAAREALNRMAAGVEEEIALNKSKQAAESLTHESEIGITEVRQPLSQG